MSGSHRLNSEDLPSIESSYLLSSGRKDTYSIVEIAEETTTDDRNLSHSLNSFDFSRSAESQGSQLSGLLLKDLLHGIQKWTSFIAMLKIKCRNTFPPLWNIALSHKESAHPSLASRY